MIIAGEEIKTFEPKKFDGGGQTDEIIVLARSIVEAAMEDEAELRGECQIRSSLNCFLQFRIAEVIRQILSEVK